ncbi:hypothetical protein ACLKA7_005291 [Drosophila subpalustris]
MFSFECGAFKDIGNTSSCCSTVKPSLIGSFGYRRSTVVRSSESKCSNSSQTTQASTAEKASALKVDAKPVVDEVKFNCQLCSSMDMIEPSVCNVCDKKLALKRAPRIHIIQNCEKISPAEKRKLQYTKLNHVENVQLPV